MSSFAFKTYKEIPSSLDTRPIGIRLGDPAKSSNRVRPNAKYAHIKSGIDSGNSANNTVMKTSDD